MLLSNAVRGRTGQLVGKTLGRTLGQTTGRTFATTGTQPKLLTSGIQPKLLTSGIQPKLLTSGIQPKLLLTSGLENAKPKFNYNDYLNKAKDFITKVNKDNVGKVKGFVAKPKKTNIKLIKKAIQGTKNYINSSQMKIKFNNFIQSVKNKYKDFSEKFLEGFKNNFNFALKEKLINNNKLSYLLEIADGIKNQIKLKSYLKTINDYIFNLALNSKGRLQKFVSNLKFSIKFLNGYSNKKLNLDKIINNIKIINLKIFINFLKYFDLLMTLSLVYFTTEIIIKNYDQQLKINAYKKLIKEISSKLGENENKDNLEKLLEINDSMYLVISKGGYINKYKNSENKNSNILNLQKEIVEDINENIFNRNDKMITRLKSLQNEIYDIEKEKEKNVALRTYEILKSKFSEKVLNNKSFDKLTPAQINERNLFLESSHILLSS